MDRFKRKLDKYRVKPLRTKRISLPDRRIKTKKLTQETVSVTPETTILTEPQVRLYHDNPSIGILIGTYGSPEYIELHLATRSLLYPDTKIIIHDDHSNNKQLSHLCAKYNVTLITSPSRYGWTCGDIRAYAHGIKWAFDNNIDILVKLSRRLIPLKSFVPDLIQLACTTQCPTMNNVDRGSYNFGFRTEILALSPKAWIGMYRTMLDCSERKCHMFVEATIHQWAKQVLASFPYSSKFPDGFAVWDFMSTNRNKRCDNFLWHFVNNIGEYRNRAEKLGLTWTNTELGY